MAILYVASLIGLYLIAVSYGMLFKQDELKAHTEDVTGYHGYLFIAELLIVLFGILLAVAHHIWDVGWPVVFTMISWLFFLGGLIRLYALDSLHLKWMSLFEHPFKLLVVSSMLFLIGVYLLVHAYVYFSHQKKVVVRPIMNVPIHKPPAEKSKSVSIRHVDPK